MLALIFSLLLFQQSLTGGVPVPVNVGTEPVELGYVSAGDEIISLELQDLSATDELDLVVEVLRNNDQLSYHDVHDSSDLFRVMLSEAGNYTIHVHTFNGVQTGEVEVTLTSQPRVSACEPGEMRLIAHQAYTCWLELETGDRVNLAARDTSGTLDPVLRLYADDDSLLMMNDDHGTSSIQINVLDAAITDYRVTTSGQYRVQVSDFSGAAGTVELSLDHAG